MNNKEEFDATIETIYRVIQDGRPADAVECELSLSDHTARLEFSVSYASSHDETYIILDIYVWNAHIHQSSWNVANKPSEAEIRETIRAAITYQAFKAMELALEVSKINPFQPPTN